MGDLPAAPGRYYKFCNNQFNAAFVIFNLLSVFLARIPLVVEVR